MKKAAYLAFALLGVIWGSNFIFMKWAAQDIPPRQIVLLRVVFGFLPIFFFAPGKAGPALGTPALHAPLRYYGAPRNGYPTTSLLPRGRRFFRQASPAS